MVAAGVGRTMAMAGAFVVGLRVITPAEAAPGPAGRLAAVMLPLVAHTALHELAHAAAGRALRFRVSGIVIGTGPRWATVRIGSLRLELRGVLAGGATSLATNDVDAYRVRKILVLLAGPAANLVLYLAAQSWDAAPGTADLIRQSVAFQAVILMVGNLWPGRVAAAWGVVETDGSQVWSTALLTDAEVRERAALVSNALAYALALVGDPASLDEADRRSAEAIALLPDHVGVLDTRGLVLVRMGRYEEALAPLQRSLRRSELPDSSRAAARAHLALARHGLGDHEGARRDLAAAALLAPGSAEVVAASVVVAEPPARPEDR